MYTDLDTFLITVYCLVDDLCGEDLDELRVSRPGPKPTVSDSELLTLMLLAQWQRGRSERGFLSYVRHNWQSFFPWQLSQSQFNRRTRDLAGELCRIGPLVAQEAAKRLGAGPSYGIIDSVPVRLMGLRRGQQARCFTNEASVGRGGSDRGWYYGVQLLVSTDNEGFIDGFVFGPAATEGRWLAEALLRWRCHPDWEPPSAQEMRSVLGPTNNNGGKRVGPTGPIACHLGAGIQRYRDYLADRGFTGEKWREYWREEYGANVIVQTEHECLPEKRRIQADRWLHSLRQAIETVNSVLNDALGLNFPRARTYWGLLARIAAKVAAFDAAIYFNKLHHRPTFALFDPLC